MNITKGKIPGAIKVVVYGPEGIGKTTFASKFPGAVFVDTEGSTTHMDVARFDKPQKWMDIHAAADWALQHTDQIGTFIIDTMDWAEKLAAVYVCREEPINKSGDTRGWDSIEAPGFGKGYVYMKAAVQALLDKLSSLAAEGVNVVIVCHAILKKFEQPDEMGSYDRWSLKLNEKQISPVVKEWADMVLFANYKTDVLKTHDGKTKARGGQKRIMYTQHSACWDAKNRFGLADELPFEFEQISHLFADRPDAEEVHEEPKPEKPKPERIAPNADVTVGDKIPDTFAKIPENNKVFPDKYYHPIPTEAPHKKKPVKEECPPPPESMRSEDQDKQKLLDALWMNMWLAGIKDPMIIQGVCSDKGYYDANVPISDYEYEFIEGALIEAWDKVSKLAIAKKDDLPF